MAAMFGQAQPYGQPHAYGQAAYPGRPMYDDQPSHRQGMGNGAQIAMAAGGGLVAGAAGMYAMEHMGDIGDALEGTGDWAGNAMGDVGHFVEDAVDDIF